LVVAVVLAIGWYELGGLPRDHDKYGTVAVPGQQVLELPEGDVRLNFEGDVIGGGDNRSLEDQPEGLAARVTPVAGGVDLEVEDVPSWIFSSLSGDRGHEPFAKVEAPGDGRYRVQASADEFGGLDSRAARRNAPAGEGGPAIAVGEKPWNPLDSLLLGAILAGLVVLLAIVALTLPFRLIGRAA
jgi:hypothetical protein